MIQKREVGAFLSRTVNLLAKYTVCDNQCSSGAAVEWAKKRGCPWVQGDSCNRLHVQKKGFLPTFTEGIGTNTKKNCNSKVNCTTKRNKVKCYRRRVPLASLAWAKKKCTLSCKERPPPCCWRHLPGLLWVSSSALGRFFLCVYDHVTFITGV